MRLIEVGMEAIPEEPKSHFGRILSAVLALTVGAAIIMSTMERKSIMTNWAAQRCQMAPMFAAFLFKPTSYDGSAGEFAAENFRFCLKQGAVAAAGAAVEPVNSMMGKQVDAGGVVAGMVNSARATLTEQFNTFEKFFLEKIFSPFERGIRQVSIVTQYLNSSISRINAIILSMVYMGLTFYTTMTNSVAFIISTTILVLGILSGVFIPMFFVLIVFVSLLIGTVTFVTKMGYGDLVKGPAEVFCFARGTQVATEDGERTSIETLKVGDELLGGGRVEGMLTFSGGGATMYRIDDTLVSGAHLVYDNKGTWMPVSQFSGSVRTDIICPVLYCPIVSNCTIFAGATHLTKFADWEEVEGAAADAYDQEVRRLLGCSSGPPTLAPGFCETTPVFTKNNGPCGIQTVRIGDKVLDADDKWTEVIGIVCRTVRSDFCSSTAPATDGVLYYNFTARSWEQIPNGCTETDGEEDGVERTIYHLVTGSGTFAAVLGRTVYVVRDATEVGWDKIDTLTPLVLGNLNRVSNFLS
jgi:hypothetical protein